MNLNQLHFVSDAMTVDSQGTIDLINQNLNIEALLVPLVIVDKALNYVPIIGKAVGDLTKIQIDVEGPLGDPKVYIAKAKEIRKRIETEVKKPKPKFENIRKSLKKIFQ